jgi:4-aminobutyrate aminotransferase-like enzyme
MGNYMKARLEKLQEKHPIIGALLLYCTIRSQTTHESPWRSGDVRGYGLFLGVELVRSRETLEPAEQVRALFAPSIHQHAHSHHHRRSTRLWRR